MEVEEQIEELNKILDEAVIEIDKLTREIQDLKNKPAATSSNSETFWQKEKELGELRTKLLNTTKERDNIRELIGKKIEELNASSLSKEEKAEKISKLMTGEYQKLKTSCQRLTKLWGDFSNLKDKLIKLEKDLSNSRLEAIKSLEKTKGNQWAIIWTLLGIIILLSLSLSLSLCILQGQKKKETKNFPGKN